MPLVWLRCSDKVLVDFGSSSEVLLAWQLEADGGVVLAWPFLMKVLKDDGVGVVVYIS